MRIKKWFAEEVVENGWCEEVAYGNIRKCSQCGYYVSVDDFSNEYGNMYDVCEECIDKIENDEEPIFEEMHTIEDYMD